MHGPLPYIGGKRRLAKHIISCFPKHRCYCEPFAGAAKVFFHKERSPIEVLNDIDGEIVNFFRVCQAHHEELLRCLRYQLISRHWFDLLKKTDPSTLTDIQRASRFLYLQRLSFGGFTVDPQYGAAVKGLPRFSPARLPFLIEAAYKRLQNVQIECLPYDRILKKYDRPETLFYLDPPYWNTRYYRHNFKESDFVALASHLRSVKGIFIMSLNDVPEVRRIFRDFRIDTVQLLYSCQRKDRGQVWREVLIHNLPQTALRVRKA